MPRSPARLGTLTIEDAVNEALRLAAEERQSQLADALDALAAMPLQDRNAAWR